VPTTDDMFSTLQSNNANLLAITENFKAISQKIADGKGTVGELINNDELIKSLKSTLANFKQTSLSSEDAVNNLSAVMKRLNTEGSSLNRFATDTSIYQNIQASVMQIHQAAIAAQSFANHLDSLGYNMNHGDSPLNVLLNDAQAADDLKNTIRNLSWSSEKLNDDLEAVQHNFLLRGFFRRKEKRKKKLAEESQQQHIKATP